MNKITAYLLAQRKTEARAFVSSAFAVSAPVVNRDALLAALAPKLPTSDDIYWAASSLVKVDACDSSGEFEAMKKMGVAHYACCISGSCQRKSTRYNRSRKQGK